MSGMRHHTVVIGDNLANISAAYYGCPHYAPAIYQANRDILPTSMRVSPLQQLVIPHITHAHNCK